MTSKFFSEKPAGVFVVLEVLRLVVRAFSGGVILLTVPEAQLSPRDRAMRRVN